MDLDDRDSAFIVDQGQFEGAAYQAFDVHSSGPADDIYRHKRCASESVVPKVTPALTLACMSASFLKRPLWQGVKGAFLPHHDAPVNWREPATYRVGNELCRSFIG